MLDVLICVVLFILAGAFAGSIQKFVFPNAAWLYLIWFAIGMLPVMYYARYRDVCQFDNWDLISNVPSLFVAAIALAFIPAPISLVVGAFALAFGGAFIRRLMPEHKRK